MAKRVKWKTDKYTEGYEAVLAGNHQLFIEHVEGESDFTPIICTPDGMYRSIRPFKSLSVAKRYCIREAKKLHKAVGTQLDQLAKEAE